MIRAEHVSKRYGAPPDEVVALRDVSLGIARGEIVAVRGPSGSGKTTLLSLLGGLARPTSGEVLLDGTPLSRLGEAGLVRLRARKIGFVPKIPSLVPYLDVLDNVRLALWLADLPDDPGGAAALLERLGLASRMRAFERTLSEGEKQRVAVARALVRRPPLLLLDEPTADLDAATELCVGEEIAAARAAGATVVMATHSAALLAFATSVAGLDGGRLVGASTRVV